VFIMTGRPQGMAQDGPRTAKPALGATPAAKPSERGHGPDFDAMTPSLGGPASFWR
jgi:hypothetical protein